MSSRIHLAGRSTRARLAARGTALCLTLLAIGAASAGAAPFSEGDVVVYRVGSGSGSLVNTGSWEATFVARYLEDASGLFEDRNR